MTATLSGASKLFDSRIARIQNDIRKIEADYERMNLSFFLDKVHMACFGSLLNRGAIRKQLVAGIRSSRNQHQYIGNMLEYCVNAGGTEGTDVAIDVLSDVGDLLVDYSFEFFKREIHKWSASNREEFFSRHDNFWYIILRALGTWASFETSDLKTNKNDVYVRSLIRSALVLATPSIREGAARAAGDMGNPDEVTFLKRVAEREKNALVLATIHEIIEDLEDLTEAK